MDDNEQVKINSVTTVTEPDIPVTSVSLAILPYFTSPCLTNSHIGLKGIVHIIDRILDPSAQIFESDLPKIPQTFIAGSCSDPDLPYC